MTAVVIVIVILAMVAAGTWVLHRLGAQQREGMATHRFGRRLRPPSERGPQLPVLPASWNDAPPQDTAAPPSPRHTDHAVHLGGPGAGRPR